MLKILENLTNFTDPNSRYILRPILPSTRHSEYPLNERIIRLIRYRIQKKQIAFPPPTYILYITIDKTETEKRNQGSLCSHVILPNLMI